MLHSGQAPIEIVQWKIRSGSRISHGTGLLLYRRLNGGLNAAPSKLKSAHDGTVRALIAKEGGVVQPGEVLLELAQCSHPVVMKDLCAECGADLRQLGDLTPASVSMIHNVPELRVSQEQARQLGKADEERLRSSRKLVLLVDLDQTLVHTTSDPVPADMQEVHHFQLYGPHSPWYHTRVRPGTSHFLNQVSKLYELHICTFGARPYAHAIASLLDPEGRFFSHRILSRDECFNPCSKTGNLRALFPCGDSMVCIIDDREDVWSYAPNLVAVKPYLFFKDTGDINAPPASEEAAENSRWVRTTGRTASEVSERGQRRAEATEQSPAIEAADCPGREPLSDREHSDRGILEGMSGSSMVAPSNLKDVPPAVEEDNSGKATGESSRTLDNLSEAVLEKARVAPVGNGKAGSNDKGAAETKVLGETPVRELEVSPEGASSLVRFGEADDAQTGIDLEELKEELLDKAKGDCPPPRRESGDTEEAMDAAECEKGRESGLRKLASCKEHERAATGGEVVVKEQSSIYELGGTGEKDESGAGNTSKTDKDCLSDTIVKVQGECESTARETGGLEKQPGESSGLSEAPRGSGEGGAPEDNGSAASEDGSNRDHDEAVEEREEWGVEDADDYLLYLEEILRTIHEAYYALHDQMGSSRGDRIPDLKHVVPYVRRKVLKGAHLVFSGVVPTNQEPEKSRAWQTARALGARVTSDLCPGVTHLVAARPGTAKVNRARRMRQLHVVSPAWLWCCAERWEHVHEAIFPLEAEAPVEARRPRKPLSAPVTTRAAEPCHRNVAGADPTRGAASPVYDAVTGKRIWQNGPQQQRDIAQPECVPYLFQHADPALGTWSAFTHLGI